SKLLQDANIKFQYRTDFNLSFSYTLFLNLAVNDLSQLEKTNVYYTIDVEKVKPIKLYLYQTSS
ncbi:5521_t:CDS:2, partial [Diversispora eburnea]